MKENNKKLDNLGRVVIPIGIRKTLGLKAGDSLSISLKGAEIAIVPLRHACRLCNRLVETQKQDLPLCKDCIAKIKAYS